MAENTKKATEGVEISSKKDSEIKKKIKNILGLKEEIKQSALKNVSELLEVILGGAMNLDSSDVHIEAEEQQAKIRVRNDGILQDVTTLAREVYEKILSRIKLLSGIKLNITDRPQDGRFSVFVGELTVAETPSHLPPHPASRGSVIEIRVSTLPSEYGESVVLRILNPKSLINLDALGLRADLLNLFKKEIKKPNGMIIVTGPTGSGKTTTLYAFLKQIDKPEIKIITIEDPIEYHLEGISQTQVNPARGYDFATGLQSIMRQDPDVILVGEIRDSKTCQIALQAALTGHLVFSTLHTNDAAGTVARLTSLEGNLVNIGPAINLAIAQRLVRKICPKCVQLKTPGAQDLTKIKKALSGISKTVKAPKVTSKLKIPQAKGCKQCNFTGYRGRIGIFEAILIDDDMEGFILKNPSIAAFKAEAIKKGMSTIYQDGIIKVLEGLTTIEEVERVTGE